MRSLCGKTEKELWQNLFAEYFVAPEDSNSKVLYFLKPARAYDGIIRFLKISEITRGQHKEISLIEKDCLYSLTILRRRHVCKDNFTLTTNDRTY